ncbi:MAG: hypothetical protein JW755_13990 [Candidatus Aminicenantes bacterium]|nr:hypothetical protein [Candidatus Aminicenantes bacterium]
MDNFKDLRGFYRTAVIFAWGVVAALAVYVVVVEWIQHRSQAFSGLGDLSKYNQIRYLFYILSAAVVVGIRVLKGILLKKKPSDDPALLPAKLLRGSIIIFLLCEIPALFGLVLFLLSGVSRDFYILLFISLFLMYMFFPRFAQWKAWVEQDRTHYSTGIKPN